MELAGNRHLCGVSTSPAILFFHRSAYHRASAARLGGQRVVEALNGRAERVLCRSGLPVYRVDESAQRGATFGARLAAATRDVFAAGHASVLIVGNDCLSLSAGLLRSAAQRLRAGRTVLGPDHRGGSWLIGLQRADFCADRFAALPWQTTGLLPALRATLPADSLVLLGRRSDANSLGELLRLARDFSAAVRRALAATTAPLRPAVSRNHPRPVLTGALAHRGPPEAAR